MSVLKQEAIKIIEEIQEDAMSQVITYLKQMADKKQSSKSLEGFHTLQSFAGTLPPDFDYKKELEEVREEKKEKTSSLS